MVNTIKGYSLEELLKAVEEPISAVIISHQYLVLLVNLVLVIKLTGKKKVDDEDIELFSKMSVPDKISLMWKSTHLENKGGLRRDLTEINRIRNKFAHKMFTEKAEIKEYLNREFIEDYKKKAIGCSKELWQIYNSVYTEVRERQ